MSIDVDYDIGEDVAYVDGERYLPERGTCHTDETERIYISWQDGRHLTIHVMECSACGRTYEHVNGSYEYCPHCGRRIEVDESE